MCVCVSHQISNIRPFILKHCKEGGAITSVKCVGQLHMCKLFTCHFAALKVMFTNEPVSIMADKTIGCRDHGILNWIVSIHCASFLIDVVTMRMQLSNCNSSMHPGSAAYCKKG